MFIWSLGGHSTHMAIFDNVLIGTSCTWEVSELRKLVGALVGNKSSKTN